MMLWVRTPASRSQATLAQLSSEIMETVWVLDLLPSPVEMAFSGKPIDLAIKPYTLLGCQHKRQRL